MPVVNRRLPWLLLGVAASGFPAALVWVWLGEPSMWVGSDRGLVMTEPNAVGQFQVVGVYTLIGVVVGLVAGFVVQLLGRPGRWQTIVGLACAVSAAALICWQLGIVLGPPDPSGVTGVENGELVPAQFAMDSIPSFLVWPLAAILTFTLAMYLGSDGVHEHDEDVWAGDEAPSVNDRSQQ